MSKIFTLESANIYAGDADPTASNHLAILDLKLPTLEEEFADWKPGGSRVSSEVETGMAKLEATFNLAGWTPQVMKLIGASSREKQVFTMYGVLRDRQTGKAVEAKSIMQGRMGRSNPTNFRRTDMQQHEYSIKGIVHYELYMNEDEIYFWDMFTGAFRVGGEDINFDTNRILRVPFS